MCKKQGGKNFMFRIHWSKPAKLQVNWVSSLGQTGSSCWLNPDLASHHCKISPSFTKASTFIGQTCNFVHLLYSSCLIFNLGDTTNPALIASIKPQNFLLLSCGAGSVHPTEVNSPSLPLLKVCDGTVCVTNLCKPLSFTFREWFHIYLSVCSRAPIHPLPWEGFWSCWHIPGSWLAWGAEKFLPPEVSVAGN